MSESAKCTARVMSYLNEQILTWEEIGESIRHMSGACTTSQEFRHIKERCEALLPAPPVEVPRKVLEDAYFII